MFFVPLAQWLPQVVTVLLLLTLAYEEEAIEVKQETGETTKKYHVCPQWLALV